MLGQVGPTRFDLAFSIGSIPVRVHPAFWLVSAIMGADLFDKARLDLLLIWMLSLFVSILIHELGHATMAMSFGWPPSVYLYHFGGLAMYQPDRRHSTGRSIAVSLAGPAAGFCLYGLIYLMNYLLTRNGINPGEYGRFAIRQMTWINLSWGLVNLLPVLPLDGGRICEALCVRFRRYSGTQLAAKISVVVAGSVAAWFLWQRDTYGLYPTFLFGMLCFQNVQTLQADSRRGW